MEIRLLERSQFGEIYEEQMKGDFAADELKPLAMIYEMYDRGIYAGYGLYEGAELLGYALFVVGDYPCALLDYLAICRGCRNVGLGTTFLTGLREVLAAEGKAPAGIVLESERPEAGKDEADRELRRHRLGFYERNGFVRTELKCVLFGVEFTIMYRPAVCTLDEHGVYLELKRLYQAMSIWGHTDKIWLEEAETAAKEAQKAK